MSDSQRDAVVAEALTWLRTLYHHHARLKGVGVDCAQLPIAVYSHLGLIEPVNPSYVRDWHLHRNEELYVNWVLKFAREIDKADLKKGDFGVWKFGRTFSHGVILIDPPEGIHAYINRGVELCNINRDVDLMDRPARFFTLWSN